VISTPPWGKLFPFLALDHPLRQKLDQFEAGIADRWPEIGDGTPVADLKVRSEGGSFLIEAFYWSLQRKGGGFFEAHTLSWSSKRPAEWLAFPRDPYLAAVEGYFRLACPRDILRYVPLRRLTFRETLSDGSERIGKFKRRSRFREGYERLHTIHRLLGGKGTPFRIAAPIRIDEQRCLYFQEALQGKSVGELMTAENGGDLVARAGALHSALHKYSCAGLPLWEPSNTMRAVRRDAGWIEYLMPQLKDSCRESVAILEAHIPPPGSPALCHGDPDCGQILAHGTDWSLLDFDACHAGDPYRDIAMFVASLDYHVPCLAALAASPEAVSVPILEHHGARYLEGYFAGAAPPDPRRLAWHRACAEMYYLALMLKKDRWSPCAFDRRWRRMEDQTRDLASS